MYNEENRISKSFLQYSLDIGQMDICMMPACIWSDEVNERCRSLARMWGIPVLQSAELIRV